MNKTAKILTGTAIAAGSAICVGIMAKKIKEKNQKQKEKYSFYCNITDTDQISAENYITTSVKEVFKDKKALVGLKCVNAIKVAKEEAILGDYLFTFIVEIESNLPKEEVLDRFYDVCEDFFTLDTENFEIERD